MNVHVGKRWTQGVYLVGVVGLSAAALAACGGSDSASTSSPSAAETSAAASPTAAASSPTASTSASDDGGGAGFSFSFGSSDIDSARLETAIQEEIEKSVTGATAEVSCPDDIKAEAGSTFDCTATVNGQQATIVVTQKDGDGNVSFESQQAFLFMDQAQDLVTNFVTENVPGTWTTTCNPPGAQGNIYVATPQTDFECQVTGTTAGGEQQSGTAIVTVDDNEGNVSVRVE
jgi:hypothetical protein